MRQFLFIFILAMGLFQCRVSPVLEDQSTSSDQTEAQSTQTTSSGSEVSENQNTDQTQSDSNSVEDDTTEFEESSEVAETEDVVVEDSPEPCPGFSDLSSVTSIDSSLPTSPAFEPSGIYWHERLQKVFVISDEGYLSQMDADGSNVTTWNIGRYDLEGLTVANEESDLIYLGVEYPAAVLEFNFETGSITRTFSLYSDMGGTSSQGLESLTFVQDDSQVEGGFFYAGLQQTGEIFVFELSIASSSTDTTVTLQDTLQPKTWTDVAGLSYDSTQDLVYVVYDANNKIVSITPDGTVQGEWTLSGSNQEGVSLDLNECVLYIAQDSGEVYRYEL